MLLLPHPVDYSDVSFFFNEADEIIKHQIRSSWPDEVRARAEKIRVELHTVGVSKKRQPGKLTYELDETALYAAARWNRVNASLRAAGDETREILRLRMREVMRPERTVFGFHAAQTALGVRRELERGPGMLADLTEAAARGWRASRSPRSLALWLDGLGTRVARAEGSPGDRQLVNAIKAECAALELQAWRAYGKAKVRTLPPSVRRAGRRAA